MQRYADDQEVAALEIRIEDAPDELSNVLQAELAWHMRQRDTTYAVSLADAVATYFHTHAQTGAEVERALALLDLVYCEAEWLHGKLDAAERLGQNALKEFERLNDCGGISDAHVLFGLGEYRQGQ